MRVGDSFDMGFGGIFYGFWAWVLDDIDWALLLLYSLYPTPSCWQSTAKPMVWHIENTVAANLPPCKCSQTYGTIVLKSCSSLFPLAAI